MEDLQPEQFTFSAALQAAGYNTGLIGKWHVGTRKTAADFGFDGPTLDGWHNPVDNPEYLQYLADNNFPAYRISDQVRGILPNGGPGNLLAARLHQPVEATFEYFLAERAIALLREYAEAGGEYGKPFFLGLHFFGPHLPYLLPDEYYDMYDSDEITMPESIAETFLGKPPVQKNYSAHWTFDTMPIEVSRKLIATYWGYVTLIDQQIGRVLDVLDELGISDDTAVFFSSDHGEFTGSHRLHDKGPAMYEDIYRTAGIVRVPGMPQGQVSDEFVTLTDCTATILALAGIDPTPAVDSRSLLPLVGGENVVWQDDVICEFHGHHFPYPQRMIRNRRHKLIVNPDSVNELYDLQLDASELHNRYEHPEYREIRAALLHRLYTALVERGDNFYHWMTSMYEIGNVTYDPTLGGFDEAEYSRP
jgi:arylsulfatase A-like enzyme